MSNFFLRFLERVGRKRVILDRTSTEPYLSRYYLFLKDRKDFPFNVFLHNFHKSDPDDLHDHPWPYATLILKGGYWEWVPMFNELPSDVDLYTGFHPIKHGTTIVGEKKVWRGPGHFRICSANSFHRIEIEPTVDCWTVFMPGAQKREWGFLTHTNWMHDTFKWIRFDKYISTKTNTK
jgi:hypothetical protein